MESDKSDIPDQADEERAAEGRLALVLAANTWPIAFVIAVFIFLLACGPRLVVWSIIGD